jgi:hypothetical protein
MNQRMVVAFFEKTASGNSSHEIRFEDELAMLSTHFYTLTK